MLVTKEFKFDAAHHLINYHGKCENLHGHTYKMFVTVEGTPNKDDGMVMDFCELKEFVNKKVISKLDHSNLNDTIENPSAENIAIWAWERLKDLPVEDVKLKQIKVYETATSFVTYEGD